jgi:hypothetical protein
MKRGIIIAIISAFLILVLAGFIVMNKPTANRGNVGEFGCSDLQPGEWQPQQGECQSQEMQQKCDEFCSKHPDCCLGWQPHEQSGGYGQMLLPLPSAEEIASLTRNYPLTIKAINEGPLIYSREEKPSVISDEKLEKIKGTGFNTIQIMLIGKWEGDKIIFNDVNNAVLLNDIVAIKKHGLAVWVALDHGGGTTNEMADNYDKYKSAFLNLINESAILMEKYKVEYFTVSNEPDHFFGQQSWRAEGEKSLVDFFPSTNELARKNFQGKLINKITQPKKHELAALDASLENVDIAGVDVGPPISESMTIEMYKGEFDDYQFYADAATAKGVQWMNAEYWQGDFEANYSQFTKEHQKEYAEISFNAYLAATPKGAGYTYNDFSTFSLQPNGEVTRQAIKSSFEKI